MVYTVAWLLVNADRSLLPQVKRSPEQFIIKHYAGDVQYSTIGFVAKNSDKLTDTLMTLVRQYSSALV